MSSRKITVSGGEEARHVLDHLITLSQKCNCGLPNASQGSQTCPICYDSVSSPHQLGCGHTYCSAISLLFSDPTVPLPETTEELVDGSGEMMLLERLLDELFRTKHKVLLFSQFTTVLDIIEVRVLPNLHHFSCVHAPTELKGWRIDGSTSPLERREQMNLFQGNSANAPVLFLLSMRAGGLGITPTVADTVIFYDQDWNPQMDIQAQDRAHRIGQAKAVLVFRLVTAHTIETRIMQRATEKRQLEALVIAKGKFKMPGHAKRTKADNIADMAAALLRLEGDHIEVVPETREGKEGVLSDRDLGMLLDRSEAMFTERRKGWLSEQSGTGAGEEEGGKKAAFAVYEAPVHNRNEPVTGQDHGRRCTRVAVVITVPNRCPVDICWSRGK
ncbi:P-loop containing nucleoside triphosphate hydrolase protein [Boletus coccyginus]|nr:P-loop containing nucleoside triphosphate hydrolase protein [Boletus coccyginus]